MPFQILTLFHVQFSYSHAFKQYYIQRIQGIRIMISAQKHLYLQNGENLGLLKCKTVATMWLAYYLGKLYLLRLRICGSSTKVQSIYCINLGILRWVSNKIQHIYSNAIHFRVIWKASSNKTAMHNPYSCWVLCRLPDGKLKDIDDDIVKVQVHDEAEVVKHLYTRTTRLHPDWIQERELQCFYIASTHYTCILHILSWHDYAVYIIFWANEVYITIISQ